MTAKTSKGCALKKLIVLNGILHRSCSPGREEFRGARSSHSLRCLVAKFFGAKDLGGGWGGGVVKFFLLSEVSSGRGCGSELLEGFGEAAGFPLTHGGSCRLWQASPVPGERTRRTRMGTGRRGVSS